MKLDDLSLLKLEAEWMRDRFRETLETDKGLGYVIEDDTDVLCAFGAVWEWSDYNACEVWFNLIKRKKMISMISLLKRLICIMADSLRINRMQALVDAHCAKNIRFLEFLGFHNETPYGMKNKMYNGGTAYLYSRIF